MSTTVFGEPLETVMARADESKVPKMLQHTLGWLNTKGAPLPLSVTRTPLRVDAFLHICLSLPLLFPFVSS